MKNQYFGDRRDYLKYSLIRALGCELSVAVCWLLTDDNSCTGEGRKIDYLCKPDDWRKYDPPVYDFLRGHVRPEERCIDVLEEGGLLGDKCRFFSCKVPSDGLGRFDYFEEFIKFANGAGLVFFDPDTGIEPPSGKGKGQQYVRWHELAQCFSRGHSLLIYQHFGRQKHKEFVKCRAEELAQLKDAGEVHAFYDDAVVFFLVAQPCHIESLKSAKARIECRWGSKLSYLSVPGRCRPKVAVDTVTEGR